MTLTLLTPGSHASNEDYCESEKALILRYAQIELNELSNDSSLKTPICKEVKMGNDFAGNRYCIIECEPTGYLIMNYHSGIFTEISLENPSPYEGFMGEYYYGGPMNYYVRQKDDKCINVVNGATASFQTVQEKAFHYSKCMHEQMVDELDNRGNVVPWGRMEEYEGLSSKSGDDGGDVGSVVYVPNMSYISSLRTKTEMGYTTDGNAGMCGWITSGIYLLWLHMRNNNSIIPQHYLTNGKFNGSSFTWLLRSYGLWSYTMISDLCTAINRYASVYSKPIFTTFLQNCNRTVIASYIDRGIPVLVKSTFPDNGCNEMHYVVMYGHNSEYLICHFGWEGQSNTYIRWFSETEGMIIRMR